MEHKVLKVMLQGVEGRNAVSGSSMLAPEQVWDLLEHVWEFGCGHEGRVGVGNTLLAFLVSWGHNISRKIQPEW